MTVRISADDLPPAVLEKLEAGESVEIERNGQVIARLEPPKPKEFDWERFIEARRKDPPLDYDDFLRDLETAREWMNRPAEPSRWE